MPVTTTLRDLIIDIHALDAELRRYEEKYNLLSEDFYLLYEAGKLRDEVVEEIDEYGQWSGLYEMRLSRKALYDQVKSELVQRNATESIITLKPYAIPEAA